MVVRRYRSVINRLPTILMVGDEGGDSSRATAYFGSHLNAEAVGEWSRRFFAPAIVTRIGSVKALEDWVKSSARDGGAAGALASGGYAGYAASAGVWEEGKVPVLVLSPHPSHDSLLFRYLSHRFVSASESRGVRGGNGGVSIALV